jgi:hypothetical protein
MVSLFLLIDTYTAGSGGGPSSIEGSTQELALQGDELSDVWQSKHWVPVVSCPAVICFLSCAYLEVCTQAGTHVMMQLQIYPAMLKCCCVQIVCSNTALCLTFAMVQVHMRALPEPYLGRMLVLKVYC